MTKSKCIAKGCPFYKPAHWGFYHGQPKYIDACCRQLDIFIKNLSTCPIEPKQKR